MYEFKRFVINEDHLKLLKELAIGWNHMEFGSPTVDPKKPFGNSDVFQDMVKVLGWEKKIQIDWCLPKNFDLDEDELPEEIEEVLFDLYRELDVVLEICLRTQSFKPGVYESDMYGSNWKKLE